MCWPGRRAPSRHLPNMAGWRALWADTRRARARAVRAPRDPWLRRTRAAHFRLSQRARPRSLPERWRPPSWQVLTAVALCLLVGLTRPPLLAAIGDGPLLLALLGVCLVVAGAGSLGFFSLGLRQAITAAEPVAEVYSAGVTEWMTQVRARPDPSRLPARIRPSPSCSLDGCARVWPPRAPCPEWTRPPHGRSSVCCSRKPRSVPSASRPAPPPPSPSPPPCSVARATRSSEDETRAL